MAGVQLKLGPTDHGRKLSLDDFDEAEFEPGARYEIIDGRVYVSAEPNPAENFLEKSELKLPWMPSRSVLETDNVAATADVNPNHNRIRVVTRFSGTIWEAAGPALRGLPKALANLA